jgi:hypothetical protein
VLVDDDGYDENYQRKLTVKNSVGPAAVPGKYDRFLLTQLGYMDTTTAPALCPARALSDRTLTAVLSNVITERVSLDRVPNYITPEVTCFYTP